MDKQIVLYPCNGTLCGHELTLVRTPAGVAQFTHSPSCCPSGSTLMLLVAASSRWQKEDLGTPSTGNSGLRTSHQPAWIFRGAALQYETLPISPSIFLSITGVRPTWPSEGSLYLPCPPFFIIDKYFPQQIFYTSNPVFLRESIPTQLISDKWKLVPGMNLKNTVQMKKK